MTDSIRCFWVERTDRALIVLRRYRTPCTAGGVAPFNYCNVDVDLGERPLKLTPEGYTEFIRPALFAGHRWPEECPACHVGFGPVGDGVSRTDPGVTNDQVNQEPIYRAVDGSGEWPQRRLPAGAMFDQAALSPWGVGPDGIALVVVCPYPNADARSGFWHVDGKATNSDKPWDRTGDPRVPGAVTANPSIQCGAYHGWLRDGTLTSV